METIFCNDLCKMLMRFLRLMVLKLCGLLNIALLPEGCRAIPAGHFNFDPELVEVFGGKKAHDAINKAIIYQKVLAWIQHNEQHGRNRRDGLTWSYNTYPNWARDIHIFHQKTIEKHIRDLEAMGLLCSQQPDKADGNLTKHYSAPVRPSDGLSIRLLWSEHKTPMVGALDSDLTIEKPAINNRAMDNPQPTPNTARARKPLTGGVADFKAPLDNRDLPEKKPSTVELREAADEGDGSLPTPAINGTPDTAEASRPTPHSGPPPSGSVSEENPDIGARSGGFSATECPIHDDIRAFWPTVETDNRLLDLVQTCGDEHTLAVIGYVKRQRNVANPQGLARALLDARFMPPGWLPDPPVPDDDDTQPVDAPQPNPDDTPTEPDGDGEEISQPQSQIWEQIAVQCDAQMGRTVYITYLNGVQFERADHTGWYLSVSNPTTAAMLNYRLKRDIERIAEAVMGQPVVMHFEVRKAVAA